MQVQDGNGHGWNVGRIRMRVCAYFSPLPSVISTNLPTIANTLQTLHANNFQQTVKTIHDREMERKKRS
uniref:Uncharacterized protein n=1 Tax=Anopheles minimus TaxID=112268 RepID=A0A182WPS5_9DIPT